ncbi:Indoleacetamide hydrolase [Rhodovastum atsumiense]|uniref:Amidase family protein n=1 Tax=Rhodovastum atsumiense TaxID=504468 RepID=A0A5M6INU9_9PROT|nr:amidase family protein [Rhodovastum atsumiense]KAA5609946.1 amidase family protein [Rhodovastum atsumiense]CAH2604568.1 Indoleacetamide hydrolase [Rhodovastum atsumiense]
MSELWRLSAAQVANLVRLGKVSATEVARDALARLAAVNPAINAVVDHNPEDTLAQAAAIDAAVADKRPLGPLAGVPITIKTNIDQAGYATSNGLRSKAHLIATENNPVVDNFRKSGAVILGRTNTPAFSSRWFTNNQLYGPTRNPRDPALTPGGSSGGAAAAVLAGIGCIGHGNDIGGSVRYPAYACGIHGLRPGLGRVPTYNASGPARTIGFQLMSVQGPLARTVHDVRLGFEVMTGRDMRDPWMFEAPVSTHNPKLAALCLHPDGIDTVPEVEAALLDAAQRLRDAGWTVVELDHVPPIKEATDIQLLLWVADYPAQKIADAEAEGDPGAIEAMRGAVEMVGEVDVARFSAALTRRADIVREWLRFLETYPVLLIPNSSELPFDDEIDLPERKGFRWVLERQHFMAGPPVIGIPALTVSTGMVGTRPVGVQILAGRGREDLCLSAGEAIEARGVPPMPIDPVVA